MLQQNMCMEVPLLLRNITIKMKICNSNNNSSSNSNNSILLVIITKIPIKDPAKERLLGESSWAIPLKDP